MATDREIALLRAAYGSGITSTRELANFMAQVGHESSGLTRLEEGFRYTKSSSQVSSKVRSALRAGPEALEEARLEALRGRPERLAELMYGDRMGNDAPGDGYRYRGRGYIQLTGKNQYRDAGEALGLDLVRNPELAADPENATRIATWYWQRNVPEAARDSARAAGAAINGSNPPNGLADREARFERWRANLTPELMQSLSQGRLGETVPTDQSQARRMSATEQTSSSFDDVMRTMLPPKNGVAPHMTSDYGPRTLYGRRDDHGGVDFNYVGGQSGLNLRHPEVRSPVSGVVVYGAGQGNYGTVKIRDDQGNTHEILHLDSRSVRVTNPPTRVQAGDPIGTMGNTNPDNPRMAQHVHYQIRDPSGRTVDPERFWNGRAVEVPQRPGTERPAQSSAMADGVLRQRDRGPEVVALQETLNRLGYTGRDGRPLETRSGVFGPETHYAVEQFQRRHGLADVDGIVGRDTSAALRVAATRPLLSEATHPNHRLYAEIARQLPAVTRPEVAANVTLQAMENGITMPDRLARVDVHGSDVFVMGTTPGDRAKVDLQAPTPTMQQMSDHVREQTQDAARTRDQADLQLRETQVRAALA